MHTGQKNINAITEYFRAGCKRYLEKRVGVETEYFVINGAGEPITYEVLEPILRSMMQESDTAVYIDGFFMGYYNQDFSITLEPAAQLEISVMPQKDVAVMEQILLRFYKEYEAVFQKEGYSMISLGYHPTRCAKELSLIPKKRYEYMNQYFQNTGNRGIQMMRATASTQVSVDYTDEADFVKKYRLACVLSPIFSLLTENSPIYEGEKSPRFLTRSYVWQDVDKARCMVPDCTFREDFGFEAYAREIYAKPPILIKEGSKTKPTGEQTGAEWYEDKTLTMPEIEHLISMFFFDARLKQYLEIRPADSLPIPFAIAYVELIRGIFYQPKVLEYLSNYLQVKDKQEIEAAKSSLMAQGYGGEVYGRTVAEVIDTLFEKVLQYADEDAGKRLKPLYELAQKRMTPAQLYCENKR